MRLTTLSFQTASLVAMATVAGLVACGRSQESPQSETQPPSAVSATASRSPVMEMARKALGQPMDLTIMSKVTRDGGAPQSSVNYIASDHVRMAHGDGKESIVDIRAGQITTLDDQKKTYYVTTRQDMDAFAAKMQEQMNSPEMKRAREAMKHLPAGGRGGTDEAMDDMFKAEKSGTTRTVAGYGCENWTVTMSQFARTEECLSTELAFPPQAWEMYRGFSEKLSSMMDPTGQRAAKMQEQLKEMKGFPLASTTTVDIMGKKSVLTTEVTSVQQGPIPSSAWEVPAGYTRIDNPMMRAFSRRR